MRTPQLLLHQSLDLLLETGEASEAEACLLVETLNQSQPLPPTLESLASKVHLLLLQSPSRQLH